MLSPSIDDNRICHFHNTSFNTLQFITGSAILITKEIHHTNRCLTLTNTYRFYDDVRFTNLRAVVTPPKCLLTQRGEWAFLSLTNSIRVLSPKYSM
jgi:hypothetical protein